MTKEREAEPATIDEHLDEILHRWHESPRVVHEGLRAALIAVARDQREADRRRCEQVAAQLRDGELSEIALECARQISGSTMPDNPTKAALNSARADLAKEFIEAVKAYEQECSETAIKYADDERPIAERIFWRADGASDALEHIWQKLETVARAHGIEVD